MVGTEIRDVCPLLGESRPSVLFPVVGANPAGKSASKAN